MHGWMNGGRRKKGRRREETDEKAEKGKEVGWLRRVHRQVRGKEERWRDG